MFRHQAKCVISSFNPHMSNPSVSDPFKVVTLTIPLFQPSPLALHAPAILNYQFDGDLDPEAIDSELRFQQEFALLSMKYKRPISPNHKPYHNLLQSPHQSNPQPFSKPSENPPAYKPNISTPNHNSKPHEIPNQTNQILSVTSVVMQITMPNTA